jgi:hypothetical protein
MNRPHSTGAPARLRPVRWWRRRCADARTVDLGWEAGARDADWTNADWDGEGWDGQDWAQDRAWESWSGEVGRAVGWLPELVEVSTRRVRVGADWIATLAVIGWPHQVMPGWLNPLLNYPGGRVDVCLHIEPVGMEVAARRLRQQLARLESSRAMDAQKGRLADPHADASAADAHELTERLARAQTRLHRLGLYLTVRDTDPEQLTEHVEALRGVAAAMMLDARPVAFRALQGWVTTLPMGLDRLRQSRVMDTDAVASMFPFASLELPGADPVTAAAPSGVLLGRNLATGGVVIHDRFTGPNYNSITLGASGSGKSFATKLEILRATYRHTQVLIVDPCDDEYARLTQAVDGTLIRLGEPGVRINPLDLPHHDHTGPRAGADVVTRRALWMHTVLGVMVGELTPAERVVADRAIHATYIGAGISLDPATWDQPVPLLADLAAALRGLGDPVAVGLADRLSPWTQGSFSGLFAGPTTVTPTGHLITFSLRELPDELRGIGTLIALDAIWRIVANPHERRPRIVVVDEAWLLLAHPAGARFLARLAKAARKHWAGLALITQDGADVLSTDLGRAVVANAATHLLMRTATHAAPVIAAEFGLSAPERKFLTTATTGQGLLLTHTGAHVPLTPVASAPEHHLVTTDPAQLAQLHPPTYDDRHLQPTAEPPFDPLDDGEPEDQSGSEFAPHSGTPTARRFGSPSEDTDPL